MAGIVGVQHGTQLCPVLLVCGRFALFFPTVAASVALSVLRLVSISGRALDLGSGHVHKGRKDSSKGWQGLSIEGDGASVGHWPLPQLAGVLVSGSCCLPYSKGNSWNVWIPLFTSYG